ncbi:uncharacterized protein K441DRAFT_671516, partial [Cenococcum geophilum 1.58]
GGPQAYTHTHTHTGQSREQGQHSTNGRQGKIGNQDTPLQEGVSEQRPKAVFVCMDSQEDRIRR